jgi:tRNA A-37 threonylcarbamoyl transferase component Bud32
MVFQCQKRHLEILEEFKSFKNQVFKVKIPTNKYYVLKIYQNDSKNHNSLTEAVNLKKLDFKGINVPEVFYKSSPDDSVDYLLLEYVPGTTIAHLLGELDWDSDDEINKFKQCLTSLGQWMAYLHEIKENNGSFLKGDCNLRNFIWNGREICGLDYEESIMGDPGKDLGEICFFLLTNSPPLTPLRMEMVDWFLKSYKESSEAKIRNISDFIAKSARKAYIRRLKFKRI